MNSKLIGLLAALTIMVGSASAAWISGFYIDGSIVGTNTDQPDTILFDFGEIDLDSGPATVNGTYTNDDGTVGVSITYSEDVNSTDGACNYQAGVDYTVEISVNGAASEPLLDSGGLHTVVQELNPGSNLITMDVTPSAYPCPVTGTWSVTGQLV